VTSFPAVIPRPVKRTSGRTGVSRTPLAIRGSIPLPQEGRDRVRERLRRALSPLATRIDRVTIRFEDVNGPRGGVDTVCRIKAVMTGADSLLVQQRAKNPEQAVGRAIPRLVRAVRRDADKRPRRSRAKAR
jgi:ribosome-associated translation inhibitor RaiA